VRLFNQGMVKRFGQVMSKSAGNGVSIDELAGSAGADAGRIYEMFIGPPEEDVEWTEAGLNGVVEFLPRVWRPGLGPEAVAAAGGEGVDRGRAVAGFRSGTGRRAEGRARGPGGGQAARPAGGRARAVGGGRGQGGAGQREGAGGVGRARAVEGGVRPRPPD